MYLAKARKQLEEQDMKDMQGKLEKQADGGRTSQQVKRRGSEEGPRRGSRDELLRSSLYDVLPDGAFVSPKHTPTLVQSIDEPAMTITRSAEYIGSFSVCGTDDDTRAQQVEIQLQSLQNVQQGKPVELQISLEAVQVSDAEDETVLMVHELKRISYAACDPQHHQFSFLAREKHLDLQYCHTFRTTTPVQAEELNVIMGEAFKMAYTCQRDTLPTFHELIEAQIVEQQARFREIERQAQVELQRKLAEIARPTPFSQQAIQRMEQRKVPADETEPELLVGKNKLWAKHAVQQVRHRMSLHETEVDDTKGMSSRERPSYPSPHLPAMLGRRRAIGRESIVSHGRDSIVSHGRESIVSHGRESIVSHAQPGPSSLGQSDSQQNLSSSSSSFESDSSVTQNAAKNNSNSDSRSHLNAAKNKSNSDSLSQLNAAKNNSIDSGPQRDFYLRLNDAKTNSNPLSDSEFFCNVAKTSSNTRSDDQVPWNTAKNNSNGDSHAQLNAVNNRSSYNLNDSDLRLNAARNNSNCDSNSHLDADNRNSNSDSHVRLIETHNSSNSVLQIHLNAVKNNSSSQFSDSHVPFNTANSTKSPHSKSSLCPNTKIISTTGNSNTDSLVRLNAANNNSSPHSDSHLCTNANIFAANTNSNSDSHVSSTNINSPPHHRDQTESDPPSSVFSISGECTSEYRKEKKEIKDKTSLRSVLKDCRDDSSSCSESEPTYQERALSSDVESRSELRRESEPKTADFVVTSKENRPLPTAPPVTSPGASNNKTAVTTSTGEPTPQRPPHPSSTPPQSRSLDEDDPNLATSTSSPSHIAGAIPSNGVRNSPQRRTASDSSAVGRPTGKRHNNWELVNMLGTAVESKSALMTEETPPPLPPGVKSRRPLPPEPPDDDLEPLPEPPTCISFPPPEPPTCVSFQLSFTESVDDEECAWPPLPSPSDVMWEVDVGMKVGDGEEESVITSPGATSSSFSEGVLEEEEEEEVDEEEEEEVERVRERKKINRRSLGVTDQQLAAAGFFSQGMMESSMSLDRREIEDPCLRQAPWYQPGIPREIALEILQQDAVGSFIVRDSATHLGCFALSVRVPEAESRSGVSHYVIAKNPKGYRLKGGSNKDFANLTALVNYHSHTLDSMPCKLRKPNNMRNLTFLAAEREDSEEESAFASESADLSSRVNQLRL